MFLPPGRDGSHAPRSSAFNEGWAVLQLPSTCASVRACALCDQTGRHARSPIRCLCVALARPITRPPRAPLAMTRPRVERPPVCRALALAAPPPRTGDARAPDVPAPARQDRAALSAQRVHAARRPAQKRCVGVRCARKQHAVTLLYAASSAAQRSCFSLSLPVRLGLCV